MHCFPTMAPLDDQVSNRDARDIELAPPEKRQGYYWLITDRTSEALREGGMLVVVFGLLDYFLGEGKQGAAWPWKCSAVDVILWSMGVALELGSKEARRRWIEH
jgi:hypothetical protein